MSTECRTYELQYTHPVKRCESLISKRMIKHIVGMTIFQIAVLVVLTFFGDMFIEETMEIELIKFGHIYPGRAYTYDGQELYSKHEGNFGSSRHYTIVFTSFVFMQIFNLLNARRTNNEIEIFSGIENNPLFLVIWVSLIVLQIFIIQYTGDLFAV